MPDAGLVRRSPAKADAGFSQRQAAKTAKDRTGIDRIHRMNDGGLHHAETLAMVNGLDARPHSGAGVCFSVRDDPHAGHTLAWRPTFPGIPVHHELAASSVAWESNATINTMTLLDS